MEIDCIWVQLGEKGDSGVWEGDHIWRGGAWLISSRVLEGKKVK